MPKKFCHFISLTLPLSIRKPRIEMDRYDEAREREIKRERERERHKENDIKKVLWTLLQLT